MTSATALARAWDTPATIGGFLGAVNHKAVGRRFVFTAFVFLLVGGVEALLIRLQLALPLLGVLGPQAYNEVFTMHGTTMMFLFAVPMLEGLGSYVVPLLLGTRDMPFPRLNAFGYWCFLGGGLFLHASFLVGDAPDGGWFNYVPLTGPEFTPSASIDFWLLGVTLVEVAGIVFAIEMIVLVLKQRCPGMALSRMPLLAWSFLATAFTMLFAFPPLVVGSVLLELDRKAGTRFYDHAGGGDPVLWQHLFWFFGHPDVYILFLPAAGIVSMILPTFVRRPVAGYAFLVGATLATAMLSFGVWVHHMYAVGLPLLTMSFFAAASLLFAVPNGVQYFAWTATAWRGGPVAWTTPMLYVAGFLVIFLLGGMTGVMVAIVPFDWQVHDTFFVVAHFHYVLIGGVVLPFLAGIHYWWPKLVGRMPDERLGRWSFWLVFAGFNLAFFVQHFLGFLGMPRRVYTFLPGLGWDTWNLISTVGAFLLAAGIGLYTLNLVLAWRRGPLAPDDPWGGGTLEWATTSPPQPYNFESIPVVTSREPLWEPAPEPVRRWAREWTLPLHEPADGRREVVGTSELDAVPEEVYDLPQQSRLPLWAALALTAVMLGVLVDLWWSAIAGAGGFAVAAAAWLWPSTDVLGLTTGSPRRHARAAPRPAGWWGSVLTLACLSAAVGALVASYLYLRARQPEWPPQDVGEPSLLAFALIAALVAGHGALPLLARRGVRRAAAALPALALLGAVLLGLAAAAAVLVELRRLEVSPAAHVYGSLWATLGGGAALLLLVASGALGTSLLRLVNGRLEPRQHLALTVAVHVAVFAAGSALALLGTLHLVPHVW